MLPFDNKSEFQVIIDMPDGTHAGTDTARCAGAWKLPGPATGGA